MCRLSTSRGGMSLSRRIAWRLDPVLLRLSGGRVRSTGPVASALLETQGARSGARRRNATLYFHDGDRVTIIASRQGSATHPAWYYNLRRHPEVVFGGLPFRAQIVTDEAERTRLWALADRVFPQFAEYREMAARAGREIPIVQLVARP
jgi:deazaflavin-dependent oxidoreductase (nitroreductase family)